MTTTDLVSQDPASVLILRSCLMGIALQYLGRHLRLIKVAVDPGSNSTFSKVQDLTAEMVSTTIILVGVTRVLLGILTSGIISLISGGPLSSTNRYASVLSQLLMLVSAAVRLFILLVLFSAFPGTTFNSE